MTVVRRARRWAAFAFAAAAVLVCVPSPVTSQTVVGLEKGTKPPAEELSVALDRLRDGWRSAMLVVGARAAPTAAAEVLVGMIHEPIKLIGFAALAPRDSQLLKSAILDAEAGVREAGAALERGDLDMAAARAEVQRALDVYLSVLTARLEGRGASAAGVEKQ